VQHKVEMCIQHDKLVSICYLHSEADPDRSIL